MNLLKDYTGGHDLSIDDLTFLQTVMRDGFAAMCAKYGSNFILSGCERSDTTIDFTFTNPFPPPPTITASTPAYAFTPGIVVVNGEICVFDGQTIFKDDWASANFVVNETNGSPQVLYKDGQLRDVYKIRKCSIVGGTGVGNVPQITSSRWLWDLCVADGNQAVGIRRVGDTVELQGAISINADLPLVNSIYGGKLFPNPLPPALRPATTRTFHALCWPQINNLNNIRKVTIVSDGNIYINSRLATDAGSNQRIDFTGLSFPLKRDQTFGGNPS